MQNLKIQFSVSGYVEVEVEIPDDINPQEFVSKLGKDYLISISPNAPVLTVPEFEHIGKVVDLTNVDAEYGDYSLIKENHE